MKIFAAILIVFGLVGCTSTPPEPTMMGGSKSDGVVEIGYDFGVFSSPSKEAMKAAEESLIPLALQSCKGWGYSETSQMGPPRRKCAYEAAEGQACYRYTQTYKFQCGN